MTSDPSFGWDAIADQFLAARSRIGVSVLQDWARHLPAGAHVLDIGCGSGVPVTETLLSEGCTVSALDASPRLVAAFRRNFPDIPVACEPAETSSFFGQSFDAAIAVGLLFLLPEPAQVQLCNRVSDALRPGGRFLFTAPTERCSWSDSLTGQLSISLGLEAYTKALEAAGLRLSATFKDEGQNAYIDAVKS